MSNNTDEFLKKYDINCSLRTLMNTVMSLDLDKLSLKSRDDLDMFVKNLIGLFDNAAESIEKVKSYVISEITKKLNIEYTIEVSDGEWFYYADAIDTPMFILAGKGFRYINGNMFKQKLDSFNVTKTLDNKRYIVSHKILPLTKIKVQ